MAATSSSFARISRMASSSSRASRSGQNSEPSSTMASAPTGAAASGPRRLMLASRWVRWNSTVSVLYSMAFSERSRRSGMRLIPLASLGRCDRAANSFARSLTACSSFEPETTSSTRRHSTARLPFTPSSVVQNTSARSRRTLRLSVTRVSPPVPGSTARSGSSGSDTEEEPHRSA